MKEISKNYTRCDKCGNCVRKTHVKRHKQLCKLPIAPDQTQLQAHQEKLKSVKKECGLEW